MPDFSRFRRAYPPGAAIGHEPAADGWPLRVFRWEAMEPAGSILFLGGRADIFEKYLESLAHWHARGWSIASFDWRGQGGSGRFLADPKIGHVPSFALWLDDLTDFARRWAAKAEWPRMIIAHSMGGHLALRALAERRIAPEGMVLLAPMLGFDTRGLPRWFANGMAGLAARVAPERLAWTVDERPTVAALARQTFLTHDPERYADEAWWKTQKPELALGPPSLNWVAEASRSCHAIEDAALEQIETPMLVIGTRGDKLVSPAAIEAIASRLPHARVRMFGADVSHEILRERDGPRDEALAEIDRFLDAARAAAR